MSKVSLVARWGIVFGVLSFFTLYSAAALHAGTGSKAYADAISHNDSFHHSRDFVVFADDEDDDGGGGPGHSHHHRVRMICAIDQDQLNALRAAFSTAVYTSTEVAGQSKGIVDVHKTPGVTKHDIYRTIGVVQGPKCEIIKTPDSFLLFLLPGVS